MITSAKSSTKKKRTDRTLRQMVKGKLYRQNHTKKHTHSHSQKEKKEKIYIYIKLKERDPLCGNLSTLPSSLLLLCSPLWLQSFPPTHPLSPPMSRLPTVWKLFLLHSSLPKGKIPSLFFCLYFFLFSFALPRCMGSFLPFRKSEVFC